MDRNNYGYKQLVTEGELDGSFTDCETAERNLPSEAGHAQVAVGSAPFDADVLGGISTGLVVTGIGTDTVNVSTGVARDNSGRRISIGAATVKATMTGDTTEGDLTDATGDGADIALSCCPVGRRIICSLFAVYDEHQSDARTDGIGVPYYFDEAESFHFHLAIGLSFPNPPVALMSRASLANGKVLLTDLLLENVAGAMQVIAILDTSQLWDLQGAWYADLEGRRSDVVALDQAVVWPLYSAENTELRMGSAREALAKLVWQLQSTTDGLGDDLLGAIAKVAGTGGYQALDTSRNQGASTVNTQLQALLNLFQYALFNGGANILQPVAGKNGLVCTPSALDDDKAILHLLTQPLSGYHTTLGRKYGHKSSPHEFFEDFMYAIDTAGGWTNQDAAGWGVNVGAATLVDMPGGVLSLAAAAGVEAWLATGFNPTAGNARGWWEAGGPVRALFMVRLQIPAPAHNANTHFEVGFYNGTLAHGGVPGVAPDGVFIRHDPTSPGDIYGVIHEVGGTEDLTGAPLISLAADTWTTIRCVVLEDLAGPLTQVAFQVDNGSFEVLAQTTGIITPGVGYCLGAWVGDGAAGTAEIYLDQLHASDRELQSDML